jgi:hypothetical protein
VNKVLATIGLSLIVIGWIEQVFRTLIRKHLSFSPFFLTFYLIGTAILAYNSFNQADTVSGAMNAVTVVLAFIVLMVLIIIRGKPGTF